MTMLKKFWILLIIFSVCCSACTKVPLQSSYESVILVRVVDGDTLLVDRGKAYEYVRLIGIDAPESVSSDPNRNTQEGKEASDYLKNRLKNTRILYLARDVSETDKYGRLLRYVWLRKPITDDEDEIRESMVNALILLNGYASQVTIQPDVAFAELFLGFVREARNAHVGLWE